MTDEPCAGVFVLVRRFGDGAENELVVRCEETIAGIGGVVLGFIVAPAVSACFLLEELGDGD